MSLLVDFGRVLAQIGDPRFRRALWRALLLVAAALALITVVAVRGLGALLPETVILPWIGPVDFVAPLLSWAAVGAALALSVVLMAPATAAASSFFLDDVAGAVEARHYPALPPATPPGIGRQIGDAARFVGLAAAVNVAALAASFLVPPLAPVAFWTANGLLLGREYFDLVAQRRMDRAEAAALRRRNAGRIRIAGVAMAAPLSLPVANLFVPILGVAVFTHQFHRMLRAGGGTPPG